jgi:hypothetical protein
VRDDGPMIQAQLSDGPLSGTSTRVPAIEGRPPKTIDVEGPAGACNRYCLAEWEQAGHSAIYTFLYEV